MYERYKKEECKQTALCVMQNAELMKDGGESLQKIFLEKVENNTGESRGWWYAVYFKKLVSMELERQPEIQMIGRDICVHVLRELMRHE